MSALLWILLVVAYVVLMGVTFFGLSVLYWLDLRETRDITDDMACFVIFGVAWPLTWLLAVVILVWAFIDTQAARVAAVIKESWAEKDKEGHR
ncbi:hypothetical protein [Brevibacterium sp.]|uniref:hypothetical protein n=1 Tax=Brevibacterium sp. TaxID=1701 RepID=UPI0028120299|nr:hypothetical protein [Brevibacterium sp.]